MPSCSRARRACRSTRPRASTEACVPARFPARTNQARAGLRHSGFAVFQARTPSTNPRSNR
ncbi:hypothetical protein [Lysobacter gummosus]|uniref:hypothetical protein n=1 Tax=Lysobacter gummosus TaxID=262324 RepID=UPI0036371279